MRRLLSFSERFRIVITLFPIAYLHCLRLFKKRVFPTILASPRIACLEAAVEDVLSTTIIRLPKGDDTANHKIKVPFYAA